MFPHLPHPSFLRSVAAGCLCSLSLSLSAPAAQEPAHRVVYYANGQGSWIKWWPLSNLRLNEMTHVIFFYPQFNAATGDIGALPKANETAMIQTIQRCRAQGVACMYGFNAGFSDIKPFLQNTASRQAIADALVARVQKYDFDGLDLDIEYAPMDADANLIGNLIMDIRSRMGRRRLLTAAIATRSWGGPNNTKGTVPAAIIQNYLDWANVMSYGSGSANTEIFAANLLTEYANLGVSRGKLVLGVPFFGKLALEPGETAPPSGLAICWKDLVSFINPYNETTDSVSYTYNGHTYQNPVIVNNRETQRSKARLAANAANGSMVWVAHCDTTSPTTNLGGPLWETSQAYSAMVDGFEMPPGVSADGAYLTGGTPTSLGAPVSLTGTRERVGGSSALQATLRFEGKQWNNVWIRQKPAAAGWDFTAGSTVRFEINPQVPVPQGTFFFRLYDGAGLRAQTPADGGVVRSSGWQRRAYTRAQFDSVAPGFNWSDIRQAEFYIQLAAGTNTTPSESTVLFDNLVLVNPGTARPVRYDLDTDGDGLPDVLEVALGSNPQTADSNGDGGNDGLNAMMTGNPLKPGPQPAIQTTEDGGLQVAFPAPAGRTFRIESSTDLKQWTYEGEVQAPSDGSPLVYPVDTSASRKFYRLRPAF